MKTTELIAALRWRYATKAFDPAKKIAEPEWAALEEALVLTPSSYGLQPWRFIVVTERAIRQRLRACSWNQAQVTDCSHLVVFTVRADITEADVDRWMACLAQARGQAAEALGAYRTMMLGDLVSGPRHAIAHQWAARQAYIALGNLMTSTAVLGIDTCPMEGLDPERYDEVLNLKSSGYATVVACAAGYRASNDAYATQPKARFARDVVIVRR